MPGPYDSHGKKVNKVRTYDVFGSHTQKAFASHLGWTYARLNEVINGRRQVSADSALALGEALKTGPEFWLNLQRDWDLWYAVDSHRKVPPLKKVG